MVALKVLFDEAMKNQRTIPDACKSRHQINKSGFKWCCKVKGKHYKGEAAWLYRRNINKKPVSIYASDLYRLSEKVISKGYDFIVVDETSARETCKKENIDFKDLMEYITKNRGEFMIKAIDELKRTHSLMSTLLDELAVLEDGEGADYSQIVIDYKWIANELEHRRTTLQKRGRTL